MCAWSPAIQIWRSDSCQSTHTKIGSPNRYISKFCWLAVLLSWLQIFSLLPTPVCVCVCVCVVSPLSPPLAVECEKRGALKKCHRFLMTHELSSLHHYLCGFLLKASACIDLVLSDSVCRLLAWPPSDPGRLQICLNVLYIQTLYSSTVWTSDKTGSVFGRKEMREAGGQESGCKLGENLRSRGRARAWQDGVRFLMRVWPQREVRDGICSSAVCKMTSNLYRLFMYFSV